MKKIALTLFSGALIVLTWYLFIRPFEFEVNFKTKTLPGDVIQTIRIWTKSLPGAKVVRVDSVYSIEQVIPVGNASYRYKWTFRAGDDSITHVRALINEPSRSVRNKLLIPFSEQPVERDAKVIAEKFYNVLKHHLDITSVTVVGKAETDASFCVCRRIETVQTDKAMGMMKEYGVLTSFISDFNLKPQGPPQVRVKEWNHSLGKLKFDFCFPVSKSGYLPASDSISYQEFGSERVLQAIYNGNYITSDRAWYELLKYAHANKYKVRGFPIEYFHNNPTLGLNEKEWRADVFLPIE